LRYVNHEPPRQPRRRCTQPRAPLTCPAHHSTAPLRRPATLTLPLHSATARAHTAFAAGNAAACSRAGGGRTGARGAGVGLQPAVRVGHRLPEPHLLQAVVAHGGRVLAGRQAQPALHRAWRGGGQGVRPGARSDATAGRPQSSGKGPVPRGPHDRSHTVASSQVWRCGLAGALAAARVRAWAAPPRDALHMHILNIREGCGARRCRFLSKARAAAQTPAHCCRPQTQHDVRAACLALLPHQTRTVAV